MHFLPCWDVGSLNYWRRLTFQMHEGSVRRRWTRVQNHQYERRKKKVNKIQQHRCQASGTAKWEQLPLTPNLSSGSCCSQGARGGKFKPLSNVDSHLPVALCNRRGSCCATVCAHVSVFFRSFFFFFDALFHARGMSLRSLCWKTHLKNKKTKCPWAAHS